MGDPGGVVEDDKSMYKIHSLKEKVEVMMMNDDTCFFHFFFKNMSL